MSPVRRRHVPVEEIPGQPPNTPAFEAPAAEPVEATPMDSPPADATPTYPATTAEPLAIVLLAETTLREFGDELDEVLDAADLVLALGHVDLEALAARMPERKPALCVFGPQDSYTQPPAPFRALHANGVSFRGWKIAGFSGGLRQAGNPGFYISEDEADALLSNLPSCDLLISYAPPAKLPSLANRPERGFESLGEYVGARQPMFHFYANADEETVDEGETLTIGVCELLVPPMLELL